MRPRRARARGPDVGAGDVEHLRPSAVLALAAGLTLSAPAPARGQLFIASRPDPGFTIGPLTLRANVTEGTGPIAVDVLWSIVLPPGRSAADAAQDVYLLWPGEVTGDATPGAADPGAHPLRRGPGIDVTGEGTAAPHRPEPVRRRTGAEGRSAGGRGPVRHVRPDGGSARPEPTRHVRPHPVDAAPGRSSVAHGPAPQGERAREAREVHVGRSASSWADGTCSR